MIELSAPWQGGWLGIPLRFQDGRPTVCLPPLRAAEASSLGGADTKIRHAYDHLFDTSGESS